MLGESFGTRSLIEGDTAENICEPNDNAFTTCMVRILKVHIKLIRAEKPARYVQKYGSAS